MTSDVLVIGTILGMAVVTYATRLGGIWGIERIKVSDRTETALEAIPGAVLVSLIAPTIVYGGLPEWTGALAVFVVAVRTGSIVAAMVVGIGVVWVVRNASILTAF